MLLPFIIQSFSGASEVATTADVTTAGAGSYGNKRRFILKHEGQLLEFRNERDLRLFNDSLNVTAPKQIENAPKAQEIALAPIPDVKVPLQVIEQVANITNEANYYQYLVQSQQYEALLKLYERFIDEEELELLLMAV
jgi:hypothetical protein